MNNEGLNVEDSKKFIQGCELGNCEISTFMGVPALASLVAVDEKRPEAAVVGNGIVSFVAGMSEANKAIIKDCHLFANLAANKANPEGGEAWYQTFKKVMQHLGWSSQQSGLSDYQASSGRFTMEQEGLKILAGAIAAAAVPGSTAALLLLQVAKDAVETLSKKEVPLRLFERSSKTPKGAKFSISAASESADGEVIIAMATVDFSSSVNVTNVLFWEWNSTSVKVNAAEDHLIFNQRHFNEVKDEVRAKLTASARNAIAEFDI
jgi:hypothetical protein